MQETPVAPELLGGEDDDDEDEELDEMQVFSGFVQNLDEKKLSQLFVNVRDASISAVLLMMGLGIKVLEEYVG